MSRGVGSIFLLRYRTQQKYDNATVWYETAAMVFNHSSRAILVIKNIEEYIGYTNIWRIGNKSKMDIGFTDGYCGYRAMVWLGQCLVPGLLITTSPNI